MTIRSSSSHSLQVRLAEKVTGSLTLLAVAGLVSCSSDVTPTPATTVRDSAGVRIVENGTPRWSTSTVAWTLDSFPTSEIEGDPGNGEYFLHAVRAVHVMGDGRIMVANHGTRQLFAFDASGGFKEAIGQEGEGPGEFSALFDMFRCIGDTLLVYEGVRVSILDAQGRFVRTELVSGRLGDGHGNMEAVSSDCKVILLANDEYRPPSPGQGVHQLPHVLHWSALDGSARDTVLVFPGVELFPWKMQGQLLSNRLPFGKAPVWASDGDRVYFGSASEFEVSIFERQGRVREIVRWAAEPQPVTRADRNQYGERRERFIRKWPSETDFHAPLDHFPVPDFMPAYAGLLVDDEGNLWVQQYRITGAFAPTRAEDSWWVFEPTGQWLGTVRTPLGFEVLGIQNGLVVGVFEDEDEVQHIQLFRLNKGDDG